MVDAVPRSFWLKAASQRSRAKQKPENRFPRTRRELHCACRSLTAPHRARPSSLLSSLRPQIVPNTHKALARPRESDQPQPWRTDRVVCPRIISFPCQVPEQLLTMSSSSLPPGPCVGQIQWYVQLVWSTQGPPETGDSNLRSPRDLHRTFLDRHPSALKTSAKPGNIETSERLT